MRVPDGTMYWSLEAYRILGYAADITPGVSLLLQRVHPDDTAAVRTVFSEVLSGCGIDIDLGLRLVMPQGELKYVRIVARNHPPASPEYVGALMDVTDARRTQEALHRSMTELAHATRIAMLGELGASDLVQDTLKRALRYAASFEAGTVVVHHHAQPVRQLVPQAQCAGHPYPDR